MKTLSKKDYAEIVGGELQNTSCTARHYDSNEAYNIFSFFRQQESFSHAASKCQEMTCCEKIFSFWVFEALDDGVSKMKKGICIIDVSRVSLGLFTNSVSFNFPSSDSGE